MTLFKTNLLFKNTIIFTIGEVIPKLLSFILLPIYMQYFTPSDYGIIGYTSSVFSILPIITTLGLASYVLRYYFDEENEVSKKKLVGNIFSIISLVNIIFFILGFLYIPQLLIFFNNKIEWNPYFKYSFITFFLDIFTIIPLILFRVKQDAKRFVIFNITKVLLQYILIIFFVFYKKLGLFGFYLGNLLALIPFFLISLYLMFKFTILNLNFKKIKEGLIFSLPLLPGSLAFLLLNSGDKFFLEQYVTLNNLGIYNLSSTIALSLNILISSIYKAVEPEFFIRFSQNNFIFFVNRFKKILLFFIYSSAILLALFTKDVVKLISDNYTSVYLYVPLILISVLMSGSNIIYGGILSAEKNTKSISKAVIFGTLISLTFNYLLIPKFGLYGAAISSSIAFIAMNIILFFSIKTKEIGYKLDLYLLILYLIFILPIVINNKYFFINFTFSIRCILFSIFILLISFLLKINPRVLKQYYIHSFKPKNNDI